MTVSSKKKLLLEIRFLNIPDIPLAVTIANVPEEVAFCLLDAPGGLEIDAIEDDFQNKGMSLTANRIAFLPVDGSCSFRIRLGLAISAGVELVVFEVTPLESGQIIIGLGGYHQQISSAKLAFSVKENSVRTVSNPT